MKKLFLLSIMLFALVANAQTDIYVEAGSNMRQLLGTPSITNAIIGVGVQGGGFDVNANINLVEDTDYTDLFLSANKVWVISPAGLEWSLGVLAGNVLVDGESFEFDNSYYAPSASLRVRPNDSKRLTVIVGAFQPQSVRAFQWDSPVEFALKLRFNLKT